MKKEFVTIMILCFAVIIGAKLNSPEISINSELYKVQYIEEGDSLWKIAADITPNEIDIRDMIVAIQELNDIDNANDLKPGTIIKVPQVNKVQPQFNIGFDMAQN